MQTLKELEHDKILRIIATGRSYFSLQKVLSADFPVDYVILSSGAGIMDWPLKRLIQNHKIEAQQVKKIANLLLRFRVDFMVHDELPQNHFFHFSQSDHLNHDFKARLKIYEPFARPLDEIAQLGRASQFVLIFPSLNDFPEELRGELSNVQLIRATSPLDQKSVWFELLPKGVSKRSAAELLARRYQVPAKSVWAIGNDYNDLDLLDWAGHAFVVANAPQDLKQHFNELGSNEQNPLMQLAKTYNLI